MQEVQLKVPTLDQKTDQESLFLAQRLRGILDSNPDTSLSTRSYQFSQALKALQKDSPTDLTIAELDSWYERNYENFHNPAHSLLVLTRYINADVLYKEFGSEFLVWATLKQAIQGPEFEAMQKTLSNIGYDLELLQASQNAVWELSHAKSPGAIYAQYQIFQNLGDNLIQGIDIGAILEQHLKEGFHITPEQVRDYSVGSIIMPRPFHHMGWHQGWEETFFPYGDRLKAYDIYMDSPTGLLLMYKNQPQAITTFHATGVDTVKVNQIQGLRATVYKNRETIQALNTDTRARAGSRGLVKIDYAPLMLQLATDTARGLGFKQIILQGAHNNRWCKPLSQGSEPHMPEEKALNIYDFTASKKGFSALRDGNWMLSL